MEIRWKTAHLSLDLTRWSLMRRFFKFRYASIAVLLATSSLVCRRKRVGRV